MFLTGHAAVGLVATVWTNNPTIGFFVGWLSHYAADAVPHGDEDLGEWAKGPHELRRLALAMALDLSVLALAYWLLTDRFGWRLDHALVIFGACLPDFMWGFERLVGRRLFGPLQVWHHRNHNRWQVRIPAWLGVPLQLAATAGLWWLVLRWAAI
jgi:hypothetical protein